ncbi:MAG: hypothetical protein CM1200mP39_29950 [Dehalococcoidia bacterium]|nr:MAG: hypothetical protein CM1200mP39_29950 [Dehalococcoidia bacterium]
MFRLIWFWGIHPKGVALDSKRVGGKGTSKLEDVESVEVRIETQVVAHEVQKGITPLKNVRNVIAVASGKGVSASRPSQPIWR